MERTTGSDGKSRKRASNQREVTVQAGEKLSVPGKRTNDDIPAFLDRTVPIADDHQSAAPEKQVEAVKASTEVRRERREIMRVEIKHFSAALIKADPDLAKQLLDILWGDHRNAYSLAGDLRRDLGIDDDGGAR